MSRNEAGGHVKAADWDARSYDRVADPQYQWGLQVLERLELNGDETVLDAGCGSGRVTEALVERVPRGRVIALDASSAMIAEAQRRLERHASQIEFVVADLVDPLPIGTVDAILSTATFHWVLDHDRLFANLAAVLRPEGQLVAQCGGHGNVAEFEAVVAELVPTANRRHRFETAEATADRLARAGFDHIATWLSAEPVRFDDDGRFADFLETVCLRNVLPEVPSEQRSALIARVRDRLGEPVLNYVRLNIVARRR